MNIQELFIAKVTNNTDPDFEGKVQVDIPELFRGEIGSTDLPWARQERSESSNIPEVGDWVWVFMHDEENFKNFYYGDKVTLKQYHEHLKYLDVKTALPLLQSTYPDLKFNAYANGITVGASSSATSPEYFVLMPATPSLSAHFTIDSLGKFALRNQLTSLKQQITDLQAIVQNLVTPGNLVGNLGAPVIYTQVGTDLPKATVLATNIANLFSE